MAMNRRGAVGRGRSKEARAIERAVVAAGGTVERTGQGHLKIRGPGGVAVVASDPGSNAMKTTLRTIERQAGLRLDL
jgi:predicted RNA binding protein YcfA (HicA-like mRNA interferase family)